MAEHLDGLDSIPHERLNFDLMPPGTSDLEHLIDHYHRHRDRILGHLQVDEIDYTRLRKIAALKPSRWYMGTELWLGYALFEFDWSKRVLLECPVKNNATYILSGQWRTMIGHTKLYLRTQHAEACTKVNHVGDWLQRIRGHL